MRRVCVIGTAPHAERLVAALGAERVRSGPSEPGDIVVVVIAGDETASATHEAFERGDVVIGLRVVGAQDRSPPPSTATTWYVRETDWELDLRATVRRLSRLLKADEAPAPLAVADLSALLELEARGTVARRRAGYYAARVSRGLGEPDEDRPRRPWFRRARPAMDKPTASADVTVFSPARVPPGDAVLVQVFVHLPAQATDARAFATEFDAETERRGFASLAVPLERGTVIEFELRVPGLLVEDPVRRLRVKGRAESVQFGVTAPPDAAPGTRLATLLVSQDSVPAGHVKFKLTVAPGAALPAAPAGDEARPYERAFVSYARQDFGEVQRRLQVLRNTRLSRIKVFQDIVDIEPGERWATRLYREIDYCDILLLFWSGAAHDSEWMRREVRYALDRRVTDFDRPEIVPVIIETPPHPPWPELADRHFDDVGARLIG